MCIAFTVGFDATVLVKIWQVYACTHVVGGAHPNHILKIDDTWSSEETKDFLQQCLEGKRGELATEVKVAVVSFQEVAKGQCPYVNILARSQTTNEINNFITMVMNACKVAAEKDGNTVVLNSSTYGLSCEVQGNLTLILQYLQGENNSTSVPEPDQNIKNSRYKLLGGSSPESIGRWRIEDFASDASPMQLASVSSITELLSYIFKDVGNCAVTVVSLEFSRLSSYAVNSRN